MSPEDLKKHEEAMKPLRDSLAGKARPVAKPIEPSELPTFGESDEEGVRLTPEEWQRVRETVLRGDKDSAYAQNAVDKICHYRNLAIVLGARPEQMLGEFDRKLCADGIDKDDTGNGYHMSVQDCLDDVADTWGAYDAMKARIEGMEQALEQACNILDEHPNPSARIASMSMRGFIRGGQ